VLIFGFGPGKAKDLGPVVRTLCPYCHNDVLLHHVRSKKAIRLYFVPVVPYGTDEYLLCPVCTRGMQISRDQQSAVGAMKALTAQHEAGQVSEAVYAERLASFWQQLGLQPSGPTAPPPAPTSPTASTPPSSAPVPPDPFHDAGERDWVAQLEDLERLHREGILSDDQFEAAKGRLLNH